MLTFSQISLYFSSNSLSFIRKDIFSFFKISSICTHLWKHDTQGHNFFGIIFVPNKIFKTFYTKRNHVRYYYFVNIYIKNQNRGFVWVKFLFFNFNISKRCNLFTHFIPGNKFFTFFCFYNAPLFSVKSACWNIFAASFLVILLVIQR